MNEQFICININGILGSKTIREILIYMSPSNTATKSNRPAQCGWIAATALAISAFGNETFRHRDAWKAGFNSQDDTIYDKPRGCVITSREMQNRLIYLELKSKGNATRYALSGQLLNRHLRSSTLNSLVDQAEEIAKNLDNGKYNLSFEPYSIRDSRYIDVVIEDTSGDRSYKTLYRLPETVWLDVFMTAEEFDQRYRESQSAILNETLQAECISQGGWALHELTPELAQANRFDVVLISHPDGPHHKTHLIGLSGETLFSDESDLVVDRDRIENWKLEIGDSANSYQFELPPITVPQGYCLLHAKYSRNQECSREETEVRVFPSQELQTRLSQVGGNSMLPTIENGEFVVLSNCESNKVKRFDIVIFNSPEMDSYIKRVIGLPGERLAVKCGELFINDNPVEQPFHNSLCFDFDEELVPADHFFVLGDNRAHSRDSRDFGFVPFGEDISVLLEVIR